tara:strand:+ start:1281 stop:2018 length:738 start_codon:yes stop_codon:yes gene_type:complete
MQQLNLKNKSRFINNFLSPVGKLTENTVIKVRKDEFNTLSSSADGTLIVNCSVDQDNEIDETIFLNIPDINKLIKVLSCIPDEDIQLKFNNNNIEYKSGSVGFKYHLLEDGIIDGPSVDINKIKKIDFPFRFTVNDNSINQLVKGSTFTTDTNKIYFSTEGGKVLGTLTDHQRHNVDSYTQELAGEYTGEALETPLSLSFETIRIISSMRFDSLKVNVNPDLNVFLFQIDTDNTKITVVSSGYVG